MIEINIKDNIYFKSYDKKIELNEDIINFIMSNNIDRVLYKGIPDDINYKLLKKIIPSNDIYTEPDVIRKKYKNILEICDNLPYCMIYKK